MQEQKPDLEKGTEVWRVQIEGYRRDHVGHGIITPKIHKGLVVGGGKWQILIQWDESSTERGSRYRIQQSVSATRMEALNRAKRALEGIRTSSLQRAEDAYNAWAYLESIEDAEAP